MKWLGYRWFICILCLFTLPLAACGSEPSSSAAQSGGSYKDMKSMVLDILKSDDGKKAIYEALSGDQSSGSGGESSTGSGASGQSASGSGGFGIKMILPSQSAEQIRMAVKETITSSDYKKELEKIMTDPQFAGDFAKAVNSQSKQLHMELIKDPTYQKSISDIMKSPEMMKMFLDLTKTSDFRKQSMAVMQEAMQSPLFKAEVTELLQTVVQKQLQPEVEKKSNTSDSGKENSKQKDKEGEGGSDEGGGGDNGGGGVTS